MKIRHLVRFFSLLFILTAPLCAIGHQDLPPIQGHPLYGSASPALLAPAPPTPSSDPRVLDFAERFKTTLGQVRDSNPAVVPLALDKTSSAIKLQQRATGEMSIRMRHNTGTPRYIEAAALEPAAAVPAGAIGQQDIVTARSFLRENKELLRLTDPDIELQLKKSEHDETDRRHLRFEQRYNGLRVWPAELGIHLDQNGSVYLMTGAYVPTPDIALTAAQITRDDALTRGRLEVLSAANATPTEPELIVYAPGEQTPRLAWQLELVSDSERWMVVVDAGDGRILTAYDQVCSGNVAGSGVDLLGQTRPLNVWQQGNTFFLVDTSKKMFDPTSSPPGVDTTRGGINYLDARNQPPNDNPQEIPTLFDVTSPSATGFNIPGTVSASFNISIAYDYYLGRHNRNSYDGNGGGIKVISRLGVNWFNATFSFQGGLMRIGDADTFAASLDVMAHEFTHGVTGASANLVYRDQSGAMNEAFSDIFGEMAEAFHFGSNDWLMGTSMKTQLRNMADPSSKDQPGKMSEFRNLGSQDNGGVHVNSGIINHAYYFLTEGLQGGIGRGDAEKIFYRALTTYLMQNSQFIDCRLAAVRAAKDLFGDTSVQAQRTAAAFDAVEIFDTQPTPPPPDTPKVNAADSTLFIYGNPSTGFVLTRREAALNDPVQGRFLGNNFAVGRPPSVNGAGDLAVYVTSDNDCSLVRTDGQGENKVGVPGVVHSVAMSPDRSHFGFVLRDSRGQPDNFITVLDVVTPNAQPKTYTLLEPANDGAPIGTIVNADTMAFTADGRFLVYDALDALTAPNGTQIGVFSIYALDLGTGNIFSLVPPIRQYNIGNPSLSKTNDNFMTFEAVKIDTGASTILTVNLNSGKATAVATSNTVAFPTYTGADNGIVFGFANPNGAPGTGISLALEGLADDRQTPVGNATIWLQDGGYPFIYRRGAFQGPPTVPAATRLANISTRMRVLNGDKVLIGGFIVTGTEPKKVIIRGIGPSLSGVGVTLRDPTLELHQGNTTIATNDNWKEHQAEVEATTIPPGNDLESAIVATLNPGNYTAILADKNGANGVGVVEVYDLAAGANSKLANISTRGFVDTADNVMIGGLIVQVGKDSGVAKVIVRAIGPSLQGVPGTLQDPTLELHNGNGATTASNDNWKTRADGSSQQAEIEATTIPPTDDRESALVAALTPGNYTAIVRGKGGATGVGLVEVYNLQ